jgi:hypothetical protein
MLNARAKRSMHNSDQLVVESKPESLYIEVTDSKMFKGQGHHQNWPWPFSL